MRTEQLPVIASLAVHEQTAVKQPEFANARLRREYKTFVAMAHIYCAGHHDYRGELCRDCSALMEYAALRLQRCRFGAAKPTCGNCPVHCYRAQRRDQAKAVMRYAGPRMLWRHPILCFYHFLDGFRKAPELTRGHCG